MRSLNLWQKKIKFLIPGLHQSVVITMSYFDISNPKIESVCPVHLDASSPLRASHSLTIPSRQVVYIRGDNLSHCSPTIPD